MFKIFKPIIEWVCYIATIVGLICLFFEKSTAILIALSTFCLLLLVIAIYVFVFLWQHLKRTNYEYIGYATFIKFETAIDGRNIIFEVYKQIQCKRMILSEFKYTFKWTGDQLPIIISKLQNTDGRIYLADEGSYDHVKLNLKRALVFNETETIHFHATMDDINNASQPFVESKIDTPTQIIHFRIILKHKPVDYFKPAVLKRRKINPQIGSTRYEELQTVPFIQDCKSYEHHLLEPEVGYFYRIEWEK